MKKRITIPKGFEDCDGGKCEKTQTFEVDIPDTKPIIESVPQVEIQGVNPPQQAPQIQQFAPPPPQVPPTNTPKTYTNDELSGLMPPGVNFAVCKGDNCADTKIKNKTLVTKYKSCPKCGCNMVPSNGSICPCCGVNEPQDEEEKEDYWEDSEIDIKSDEE